MGEKGLSRRAFLGFGATAAAAAAAAGLAGCAPQAKTDAEDTKAGASAGSGASTKFAPDFLTPPAVPADIKETKDCDVLVIGMGLAGTAAAKEAAEAGKKVIVLEKQPKDSYTVISMAGDFGVVGSKIQKDLGIEWAPKEDIFNEFVKETGGRADTWMLNYWYDHSGEDFDWFVENADYEVLKSTAANRETDKPNYIRPKCFPALEGYNYKEEVYPYFHGTITTNPNMQWACQAAFDDAVKGGAELIYEAEGEQLIVEDGTVKGA
ncbi:FAD-binding protein, partial [Gordonibacter sp.]|uniref:FAD-binding protein n=1 Tax=Gordonibacter sp. TaxID=1968902 RepID=UPI002FC78317